MAHIARGLDYDVECKTWKTLLPHLDAFSAQRSWNLIAGVRRAPLRNTMKDVPNINLIDFARTLSVNFDELQFVNHLKQAVDLNQIKDLSEAEVNNLFDATQFLTDYLLLVRGHQGPDVEEDGHPYVMYRGPYIQNVLTNQSDGPSDFDQLDTFGVGGADKYLG